MPGPALALALAVASTAAPVTRVNFDLYAEARARSPYVGVVTDQRLVGDIELHPDLYGEAIWPGLRGSARYSPSVLLTTSHGASPVLVFHRAEAMLELTPEEPFSASLRQRLSYGVSDFALFARTTLLAPRPAIVASEYLESDSALALRWAPSRRTELSVEAAYLYGGSPDGVEELPIQQGPRLQAAARHHLNRRAVLRSGLEIAGSEFEIGTGALTRRTTLSFLTAQSGVELDVLRTLRLEALLGAAIIERSDVGGPPDPTLPPEPGSQQFPVGRVAVVHDAGKWLRGLELSTEIDVAPYVNRFTARLYPRLEALLNSRVRDGRFTYTVRGGVGRELDEYLGEEVRLFQVDVTYLPQPNMMVSAGSRTEWHRIRPGDTTLHFHWLVYTLVTFSVRGVP